jgi:hypothetical protein
MSGMTVSGLSVIIAASQIRSWTNNVHERGTRHEGFSCGASYAVLLSQSPKEGVATNDTSKDTFRTT